MLLIDDSSTILYDNSSFLDRSEPETQEPETQDSEINPIITTPTVGQAINFTATQISNVEVLPLATTNNISIQGSPIIYVRQGAGGSGTSWADPLGDLQTAISIAPFGSEIWVSTGVYVPSGIGDRNATFTLKDGIEIYGGFGGFETERRQRNVGAYATFLSGDIGVGGNTSDNSYHVVSATNAPNYAILDGFTITGGNASQQNTNDDGGGIFIQNSNVSFANLVITANNARDRGGAVYSNSSVAQFTNVVFLANSGGVGGAMFTDANNNTPGTVTLINSTVSQNTSRSDGGGIRAFRTVLSSIGSVFERNVSGGNGGGIFTTATNANIINSTFSNNVAQSNVDPTNPNSGGGGIRLGSILNRGFVVVSNNIFWGNQAPLPQNSQIISQITGQINNNLVQGGYADGSSNLDADPVFVDAASGNLALQGNSPAINRGNNGAVPTTLINDIVGNPRISGGVIDLGAYEFFAFEPISYGASNVDLIPFYINSGYDLAVLTNHYLTAGRFEGRPTDTFDEFRYTASSYVTGGDLINAFQLNGAGATLHYINNGFVENRPTTAFDPARYLNSYDDLLGAFGPNIAAGTQHFITSGFYENRNPNLFSSDRYLASYIDLISAFAPITNYAAKIETASNHYLLAGRGEGRQITFDPNAYLNANQDLIPFAQAGQIDPTQHYILFGAAEGRPTA
ncbi:choice-of-anchor Q domain-containing protein [Chroococcus sp. FPU101]|uniref:choice-of-anchor Q domain-containing protein n=1 Tax=Chroococcus sp. FPU101 TaxID=1974212 RepID=UPI001A8E49B1|nr:choice-of-anchor Q domain-containing protein [Chroococcus sp. FPU101]GFE68871.1 hypothetical protein CFPU101_14810 [Chroococcus sp. FPU101]